MYNLEQHKKVMEKLAEMISREKGCAAIISPKNEALLADMDEVRKKSADKFIVLIMGMFSSGKSSLLNALLGEDLLPTGFLPETAVLCEMHYSETKRITMYPKKGAWEAGDEPFDLKNPCKEEIAKYASIDNEAGMNCKDMDSDQIKSKFDKMVIQWPLEILKDGVVLVDSPGLNDPYNNDYITKGYLPVADAIIYVMNSLTPYSKEDKRQLDEINDMGMRSISFGCTYFDMVSSRGAREVERVKSYMHAHTSNHSDLGGEAVHFLSSLDGLQAKQTGDQDLLVSSGYADMEGYLAKYLVESKGRDQVKGISNKIKSYAKQLKKEAQTLNQAASADAKTLEERIRLAEEQIRIIEREAAAVSKEFRLELERQIPAVRNKIETYMDTLPEKVNLDDFEPKTELAKGLQNLNPISANKKATALQQECMDEFGRRVNATVNKWMGKELANTLNKIEQAAIQKIQPDLHHIARSLAQVDMTLNNGVADAGTDEALGNAALGIAYAILTGDVYYGTVSAVYGKGALIKGAATWVGLQVAAQVALVSFGVAISWPAILAASCVMDIVYILTNDRTKQKEKILKTVVKKSREEFSKDRENIGKNVDQIMVAVKQQIDSTCAGLNAALQADIAQKKALIQVTIDEAAKGIEDREAAIRERDRQVEILDDIIGEADKIRRNYRIEEAFAQ